MEALSIILAAVAGVLLGVVIMQRRRAAVAAPLPEVVPAPPAAAEWAFEVMPLAALRIDADTVIVEANRKALERFPHVRPGARVLEAFGEHRLAEAVMTAQETGRPQSLEVRLFSADRRTYRVQLEPLHGAIGSEVMVYLTDLTEAVAYEELRAQFVANVSHELRTPLTGLGGLLEALEDPEIEPQIRARFLGRARTEITRLDALITDILFLSDLESHPAGMSGDRCELQTVLRETAAGLASSADAQDVRLEVAEGEAAWVPLSPTMAQTVVRNLMENAVRYAGPKAVATARVQPAAPPEERSGRWVELEVADDGVGIPERHLAHVFERFYRADPSRSKQMGGTGLGLSIVKHIAERFGGEATVTSREGFGTSIRVVLPHIDAPPDADDA